MRTGATMDRGFSDSTIMATVWLIRYHPERLSAWLEAHPPGASLDVIAREWIKDGRGRAGADSVFADIRNDWGMT